MSNPAYNVGDTLYLRESAAIGHLEAVRIGGIIMDSAGNWLYSIRFRGEVTNRQYGDQRSLIHGAVVYYSEDELLQMCDAITLVEANALRAYQRIVSQRIALCDDEDDDTTDTTDTTDGTG